MTTNVNPDPHADGFEWQPTNKVTAIIDRTNDLFSALQSLNQSGFSDADLSVFIGSDGLDKLDIHGDAHGMLARVVRAVGSLTASDQANQDAESALKEGHAYLTVSTDGGDEQKMAAERVLKAHNARSIRYFGRWTVER